MESGTSNLCFNLVFLDSVKLHPGYIISVYPFMNGYYLVLSYSYTLISSEVVSPTSRMCIAA